MESFNLPSSHNSKQETYPIPIFPISEFALLFKAVIHPWLFLLTSLNLSWSLTHIWCVSMSISFPLHSCLLTPIQCHLFFGGGVVQSLSRDWLFVTPWVRTNSCQWSQWCHPPFHSLSLPSPPVLNPCCSKDSQGSSPIPQFKIINSSVLSLLYGPTLTSVHDHWKNHSFDYMDICQQRDGSAF